VNIHLRNAASSYIQAQIANLRSICGDDDIELLNDMIEGTTQLDQFVGKVLEIIQTDESFSDGLKAYQKTIVDRRRRLEERAKRLRVLLASVVTELPGRSYQHPLAHLRAFDVDPKVIVTEESAIPSAFWIEQDPKLNESAIRKHLIERQRLIDKLGDCRTDEERSVRREEIDWQYPDISGACLGNGEVSIRIRSA